MCGIDVDEYDEAKDQIYRLKKEIRTLRILLDEEKNKHGNSEERT